MEKILRWAVALSFICINADAHNVEKAKNLSPQDELAWINATSGHKTDDGATVLEVLQFVQHLRPTEFKFGNFDVGYNGATGLANSVYVTYWLGLKRLPEDGYVNLGFDVKIFGTGLDIRPVGWPFSMALQEGRDAFLAAVDEEYEEECVDLETKRPLC